MRWTLGGRKQGSAPANHNWTTHLRNVGEVLDKSGLDVQDLAVSVTGQGTWICCSAWFSTHRKSGWRSINLQIDGNQLLAGDQDLDSFRSRGMRRSMPAWTHQLRNLGLLMDSSPRPFHDPYVLQVGDGFVVTAQVHSTPTESYHGPLSFGFTAAELLSAGVAGRAGDRR